MKKNYFVFVVLYISIILISCDRNTQSTDPTSKDDCDKIPSWVGQSNWLIYYGLFETVAISKNQNVFIYEWAGNYFFYSKTTKIKIQVDVKKITKDEIKYYGVPIGILPCPYNSNKFIMIITGENHLRKTITHWYLYETANQTSTKITPSTYYETGLDETTYSWLASPLSWLNSSSEGNDFLHTSFGIYSLQKEEYIEKIPNHVELVSISPNGHYKWHGIKNSIKNDTNISGWHLNYVKIDNADTYIQSGHNIRWSPDSKFIACIKNFGTSKIPIYEIHIIDLAKTLEAGKIVIIKSINLKDRFCIYRASLFAQYINENKVLVSMSENEKDRGILYEVDLNTGQRTALVGD